MLYKNHIKQISNLLGLNESDYIFNTGNLKWRDSDWQKLIDAL